MKLILAIALLLVAGPASAHKLNIIDQDDQPIDTVAEQVCFHTSGAHKQIAKLSTVARLHDYLASVPSEHKLSACARLYLDSVSALSSLVTLHNDNVCGEQKIAAIEQFHRVYMLKRSSTKLPKVLRTFVYHYAHAVSTRCASEAANFLRHLEVAPADDTSEVDQLLAQVSEQLGTPASLSSARRYQDIYLVWSLVDSMPMRSHSKISQYLSDGKKRVTVAAKGAAGLKKFQDFCLTQVRPYSSMALVPAIRLIDMGYHPAGEDLLDELRANRQASRFFETTKLCELLLPVRVLEQSSPAQSEVVFLSKDEAKQLALVDSGEADEADEAAVVCESCTLDNLDRLPTVTVADAVLLAKKVKADLSSRSSVIKRLLKVAVRKVKKSVGQMFSARLAEPGDEEFVAAMDENAIDEIDIYDTSEEESKPPGRTERSAKGALKHMGHRLYQIFQLVYYPIFCIIWAILLLAVMKPLHGLYSFFHWFTGLHIPYVREFYNWYRHGEWVIERKRSWH